ncbi:MAG: Asp-tRNA(Asn)/Glu-tRNA(Gln) amidotransferase subunit GatC [Holosporales bacterium]|jgi:aspartyl/glutamyl-tRNA(Asn/Gln) amidotransferase C subunit|nr:Asp-tRNA(Asn)/Glu-tRNA(Gln) amidotransferase subunit GatC [Holosporales bacterium]
MIDSGELSKICELAKLKIEKTDKTSFLNKLNSVFEWVNQLAQIDVSNIDINVTADIDGTLERDDTPSIMNSRKSLLSNTKFQKFDMFYVPKIVE